MLCAIAVMDIEISNSDPLHAMHGARMLGRNCDIVKQAKAHRPFSFGVMAWRPHRAKCIFCQSLNNGINGRTGSPRRQ
jgi:hypothetical protein